MKWAPVEPAAQPVEELARGRGRDELAAVLQGNTSPEEFEAENRDRHVTARDPVSGSAIAGADPALRRRVAAQPGLRCDGGGRFLRYFVSSALSSTGSLRS